MDNNTHQAIDSRPESVDLNSSQITPKTTTDSTIEGTFETEGRVSEVISEQASEDKKDIGQAAGNQAAGQAMSPNQAVNIELLKQKILQNLPSEKIMMKQIQREIEKEIDYLHQRAMKMLRSQNVNFFEMNNLLRKIRELKGILIELVKASLDSLKTLWLRYVHGIM